MFKREFRLLEQQKLELGDQQFWVNNPLSPAHLEPSIRRLGLLHPLVVRSRGTNFQIVCGFQRAKVAQHISLEHLPCFVVEASDDWQLFLYSLEDNLTIRSYNPIEISTILHKCGAQFNRSDQQILQEIVPRLGFGQNPRILELYSPLQQLDPRWHQGVADGSFSVEVASQIAGLDQSAQQALFAVYDQLRPGKNLQHELLQFLQDCARIGKKTIAGLLAEGELADSLQDDELTNAQHLDRFRQSLRRKRYPRYSQKVEDFNTILKQTKLPPTIQIRETPFFERDLYTLQFQFRNQGEFDDALAVLGNLRDNRLIKRLEELHG
ncbi:MAG TPA: ParB N-terminal domain-containing protein [bacterium]|nr:ParB N-terminal domain-containing protein [bacterium]HNT64281.1 ParB N-terminal domain-containing protein [bacterium]